MLDTGCGVGDVSLLAASLVGPAGCVVGLDTDADALAAARVRAARAGLKHESLLPLTEALGLATQDEIGVDTFAARVSAEPVDHAAVGSAAPVVGAWSTAAGRLIGGCSIEGGTMQNRRSPDPHRPPSRRAVLWFVALFTLGLLLQVVGALFARALS